MSYLRPLLLALLVGAAPAAAQTQPASAQRSVPFQPGERMEYAVSYGIVPAGTMEVRVAGLETFAGRPAYHFVFEAQSNRTVSYLYELDSTEEAWFDAAELYSLLYKRHSVENDKTRVRQYRFDQARQVRIDEEGEVEPASPRAVDQLSMMYYLRLLPYKPGARFSLQNQVDPDDNPVRVEVLKTERVKVPAGTFDTYVLKLVVKTDRGIFKKGGDNRVWVTTDPSHVPVKFTSKIGIGNFQAELTEYRAGRGGTSAR